MLTITAKRGSEKRVFSLGVWQTMPASKYGWKQVAEEPDAVAQLKLSKEITEKEYAVMIRQARKSGNKEKLKQVLNAKIDQS